MFADVLAALYRFLPPEESLPIFQQCLEPEKSEAIKICVVKACLSLVIDVSRYPSFRSARVLSLAVFTELEASMAATIGAVEEARARSSPGDLLRTFYSNPAPSTPLTRSQTAHTGRSEVDAHGNSRKISIRPKAKRYTSETLPDRDLLILSMMTLWRADVWWYHDALDEAVIGRIFSTSVSIYSMPMDPAVRWSLARTFRYLMESIVQCPVDSPRRPLLLTWVTETGYVEASLRRLYRTELCA